VRIGATNPLTEGLLPVVITRLWRQHPRLTIHVTQGDAVALMQNLRERTVDFIVGRTPNLTAQRDISSEVIFEEPQFVVAGPRNPLVRRRKIRLAELIDEPWILPPADAVSRALIAETFLAEGLAVPQAAISCGSLPMTGIMLEAGPFLGMFPRSLLTFAPKRYPLKVLPVVLPNLSRPVGLVMLRNRTLSPTAHLFTERIREVAKSLVQGK
jgi:DNA-binding transcriptional LysR family regulator